MARPTLPETAIPGVTKQHTRDHNTIVEAITATWAEIDALAESMGGSGAALPFTVATSTAFPGLDPTGAADSTAALSAALDAARGGMLVIPPGTYRVDSRITCTLTDGQDLTVVARGATFVAGSASTSQGRLFRFANTVGTVYSVTSVTESITTANEFGFTNIPITKLVTSATPTGIAAGDFVRVVADDLVVGTAAGTDTRSGQTCLVADVTGTTITVRGHLRDNFTTGVRVARLAGPRLDWTGGRFRDSATILASSTSHGEIIEARLLIAPSFRDMVVEHLMGPAFAMRHCLGWRIDNVRFDWLHNQSSAVYGYGINDYGELGLTTRIHALGVRHAYTTAAEDCNSTGASIEQYGRAYGTRVVDGMAHATMAAAWDTHGDAWGIQFINCDSYDSESAFQLRGRWNIIRGGQIRGPHQQGAVLVNDASSSGDSLGHDISGLTIEETTYRIFSITNTNVVTEPTLIHDINIRNRKTTDPIFYIVNSAVQHRDVRVAAGGTRVQTSGTASLALMTTASDVA